MPRFQTQAIEALIHPSNDIVPSWMITVPPEQVGQTKLSQPRYPQGNHSRSKSVPYESTTNESLTLVKRHSGHASLNHDSIQNMMMNRPLLLTQSFRPDFDDEEDEDDDDNENPFKSKESLLLVNTKSNADQIPPPPVPSQHTKPTFPKYARRL